MHLSDYFLEFFTFFRYLTTSPEMVDADYETVRQDVTLLIGRLDKKAGHPSLQEQFHQARFAAFAWADEAVLCSSWSGARNWLRQPLQREFYGTVNAGEEFFERLDALLGGREGGGEILFPELAVELDMKAPPSPVDEVIEVYTLCLSLGFTGKHFNDADKSELDALRRDCLSRIVGHPADVASSAFPQAYGTGLRAPGRTGYRRVFDPLSIVFILLPAAIVAAIYFAYRGLLEYNLSLWFG